jgi:hypothetical protein
VLVAICAYLLCVGKLRDWPFAFTLVFAAAAVVLLQNADVIQRLTVKQSGTEVSAEFERIKQIKQEVYAKADAVRQMTESVAGLIADEVTKANRYPGGSDHVAQEIEQRNKLRKTLSDVGTSTDRTKQILAPFDHWIPFDLQDELQTDAQMHALQKGWPPQKVNDFVKELNSLLQKEPYSASLNQAERKISEAGLSSPDINLDIERYRTFLTTGGPIPPKLQK